jgi:hypothetical protein
MCIIVPETVYQRNPPASRTKTLSQSMTVGILCAMLIIVHDENCSRVIFWIVASVWESTEAVASSMNKIWFCFNITRPRQRSCLWPTLQFSPLSATVKKVDGMDIYIYIYINCLVVKWNNSWKEKYIVVLASLMYSLLLAWPYIAYIVFLTWKYKLIRQNIFIWSTWVYSVQ